MRVHRATVGFTLMELMVALLISGLVVASGRALLSAEMALSQAAVRDFRTTANDRIALMAIQNAIASARPSTVTPFVGTSLTVALRSVCRDAYGGYVECGVTITGVPQLAITERFDDGRSRTLLASGSGQFGYLMDAATGSTVLRNWESDATLPLAIRWTPNAPGQLDAVTFPVLWRAL